MTRLSTVDRMIEAVEYDRYGTLSRAIRKLLEEMKIVTAPDYLIDAIKAEVDQEARCYKDVLNYVQSDSDHGVTEFVPCMRSSGYEKYPPYMIARVLNRLLADGKIKVCDFRTFEVEGELQNGFRYEPIED